MAAADEIRELTRRTGEELRRTSRYFEHTRDAWQAVTMLVDEGSPIQFTDSQTGAGMNGKDLAELSAGYIAGYLTESVFQHYITLFEEYTFGLLAAWLAEFPKGIAGLDDDGAKAGEKTVPLSFVVDNPDRDGILRAVIDRELDRLKYRRLTEWYEYLEDRARLKVPTKAQLELLSERKAARDLLVHNRGMANQTYRSKAGTAARFDIGVRIDVGGPYLSETLELITAVVTATSAAALQKLEKK